MSALPIKPMTDEDRSFIKSGGDPAFTRDLTAACDWCGQTWHGSMERCGNSPIRMSVHGSRWTRG